jgi:hypothetical protein
MPIGTATIAPLPKLQFFDNNGDPLAGGQLFTYTGGTTTKQATYLDAGYAAVNTNPIVLDSAGRATVFLAPWSYKFVLSPSTDTDPPTSPLWTVDGVQGVPAQTVNVDVDGVAGEVVAAGDIVYLGSAAGKWLLASNAVAASSADAVEIGMVISGGVADAPITVRTQGRVVVAAAKVAGSTYFLSTAGALVTPAPATGHIRAFGFADTTTSLVFPVTQTVSSSLRTALKVFAYSAGQGNDAGGADTVLGNYNVTVPANYLTQPGDALVIEGTCVLANTANARTLKLQVGAPAPIAVINTATASHESSTFRIIVRRRTSTTASLSSVSNLGPATGTVLVVHAVNTAIVAVDWTTSQLLRVFAAGTDAGDTLLTDYTVYSVRSHQAAVV